MRIFRPPTTILLGVAAVLSFAARTAGEPISAAQVRAAPRRVVLSRQMEPMVEITKIDDTIFYELRYATDRNFLGRQIYPQKSRCLMRRSVAFRLKRAQLALRKQGLGLKIWDAYRPAWAHQMLWEATPDPEYVAAPSRGGSYHTWGVSVDVTLVDLEGREQPMPTDFDDFTEAAKSDYTGGDATIAANVQRLRRAMFEAGFTGLRDEWWHFTSEDANYYRPTDMPLEAGGKY